MTGTAEKIERAAADLVVILVGTAFLVVGLTGFAYLLRHSSTDRWLVGACVAMAVLGALMLPNVFAKAFPRVKQIFILVFPNGIPVVGGRRRDDPPADKG